MRRGSSIDTLGGRGLTGAHKGIPLSDRIRLDIAEGVAQVRLSRPDKLNALDPAMFEALLAAGERLAGEPGLRAVVLSGEGRAFCAGLDMASMAQLGEGGAPPVDLADRSFHGMNRAQYAVLQWRRLAVPVVAAVHGVAYGGGFQLALGADMRFVGRDSRMSMMEVKWGLVPDMAGVLLLRRLVRPDVAAELVYSGRVVQGEEALRLGLATRLCEDPLAEALEAARAMAAQSPDAIRAAKRILTLEDEDLGRRVLDAEAAEQVALLGSPNQAEAVRAGLAREAPSFTDPVLRAGEG